MKNLFWLLMLVALLCLAHFHALVPVKPDLPSVPGVPAELSPPAPSPGESGSSADAPKTLLTASPWKQLLASAGEWPARPPQETPGGSSESGTPPGAGEASAAADPSPAMETADRQIAYRLQVAQPLHFVLSTQLEPFKVRIITMLELPEARFEDSDVEYPYQFRARFLDKRGYELALQQCWERTRKIRLTSKDGTRRENVSYRSPTVTPCEPRIVLLPVPSRAARLELIWADQEFPSASVRCMEQVRSRMDAGEVKRRWPFLTPELRGRLARATGGQESKISDAERRSALAVPWLRMVPEGNPGLDYQSLHVYLTNPLLQYVPPERRGIAPQECLIGGARYAAYNLEGPGTFEVTWRPIVASEVPPAWRGSAGARPPAAVTLRSVRSDGAVVTSSAPLNPVPKDPAGAHRAQGNLEPGLQTLELSVPETAAGLIRFSSTAKPVADPRLPLRGSSIPPSDWRPARIALRSWRTAPSTSPLNPEIDVVVPPGGELFALRVVCRVSGPPQSPPTNVVDLGVDLLDLEDRLLRRSVQQLQVQPISGWYFIPDKGLSSAAPTGLASTAMFLDAAVARVRFWSARPLNLLFYTRLDYPLDTDAERDDKDRGAGLIRVKDVGRQWYSVQPRNAEDLERRGYLAQMAGPNAALAKDASPLPTLEPEAELHPLFPRRLLGAYRVMEPSRQPPSPDYRWDHMSFQRLEPGRPLPVSARHPCVPHLRLPLDERLYFVLPENFDGRAGYITASLGGAPVGGLRPVSRRGQIPLSGSPGDVGTLLLQGCPPATACFVNFAPPAGGLPVRPWRERLAHLVTRGQEVDFEVVKPGEAPVTVNLHLAPLCDASGEPLVIEVTLQGPAPRPRASASALTVPSRLLHLETGTRVSDLVFLDRPGPEVSTETALPLAIQPDRPSGRYRWTLKVASGRGALAHAFTVSPPRRGQGTLWMRSRI